MALSGISGSQLSTRYSQLPELAQAVAVSRFNSRVISADRAVKYETVVKAMNQLKRSGIERVGLSVQTTGAK